MAESRRLIVRRSLYRCIQRCGHVMRMHFATVTSSVPKANMLSKCATGIFESKFKTRKSFWRLM